jgi:uncharacterized protein (DUF1778 family)
MLHTTKEPNTPRNARIEIRTTSHAKRILEEAASISHKGLTEFLLDQGLQKAERVLADQRVFLLNDEQWDAFQDALDRPAQSEKRLKKLLSEESVFEK